MEKHILDYIQTNSPDGGFLQSEHWRKFQKAWGRKTHMVNISGDDGKPVAFANVIEHTLPLAGKYFYVPRGPIQVKSEKLKVKSCSSKLKVFFDNLINLARKNNIGWIRIEPDSKENLDLIRDSLPKGSEIKKAAVDVQPREILMLDISKSEEEILAGMKQKTRYNIRLAEKKGVKIFTSREKKYIDGFCRLVKITAERDKITAHPENYYRKMLETIPQEILELYIAEYEGEIIAANLMLFFGKTVTYMHGASDNIHREVMAPYLLQWQAIRDAKKSGCEKYDFGGVKIGTGDGWGGITRFKTGFAPNAEPIRFPGCYDIIVKPAKYNFYRIIQRAKRFF